MDPIERAFQQSLCESRSIFDNLDPASARLINELQRQISKLKGDLALEKQKYRTMARDHLAELKRLREEQERRLESSLDALNSRKDQEKAVELKRVEEQLVKQRENEVKFVQKEKMEELKALERRMQRRADDNQRLALERQRREIYEEVEVSRIPDEQEVAKRQAKLMKEVFDLGEENLKFEDQVRNLTNENRSQIEQLRRMKQEHKAEIEHILRQNKIDASRDMARLKLAEQILHERDADLMEISQRAEIAEQEREQLEAEVTVLKIVHENGDKTSSESKPLQKTSGGNAAVVKRVEDLESALRKQEEEKLQLKQENAALRKKLVQGGDPDAKMKRESNEEIKRLRKRNADLNSLVKAMDERVQSLKLENKRVLEKHVNESTDVEQNIRRNLSRQHAKDISEYTRKIASRDREILDLKRRLSKYEVSSDARHEPASELDKKVRMMAMERIKMEKLVAKLYNEVPDPSEVEITYKDICNETSRLEELANENARLRTEIHELQQPSEVDSKGNGKRNGEHMSDLEVVRDLREENHRLQSELQELYVVAEERDRLAKDLTDSELAISTADRRRKLMQEDLEQARLLSQEYERAQEHCAELDQEVAETRGLLNDKDREICQLNLEKKAQLALIQEKEEEVDGLKESVSSLKNELRQNEDLVRELQKEVELASQSADQTHIGMQTSPMLTPKMYQQSSQTSPIVLLKSSQYLSSLRLQDVPEKSEIDLKSELEAAGSPVTDPYDSEGLLVNGDALSTEENSDVSITVNGKAVEKTGQTGLSNGHVDLDPQLPTAAAVPHLVDSNPVGSVSLYIAHQDYNPRTMSTSPDKEVELLPLTKGDYVYVYGEEEVSGGFFLGRLVDGTKGLVPGTCIKKLSDQPFLDIPLKSHDPASLPPPQSLELNRQFVEKDSDTYCLFVCWEHPPALPADARGYNVYVNNMFNSTVKMDSETSALLSGIPRNQYTCVSVRTVAGDGRESSDPAKLVEINLQYPSPPTNLVLQELPPNNPALLYLMWSLTTPTSPQSSAQPITGYHVYLNKKIRIVTLPATGLIVSQGMTCIELARNHFELNQEDIVDIAHPFSLTVQSHTETHTSSCHSPEVTIPSSVLVRVFPFLLDSSNDYPDSSQPSEVSLISTNTSGDKTSFTDSNSQSQLEEEEGINEVIVGGYYKALYTYDPRVNSPNVDGMDEELTFEKDDIIMAVGELDEDGFFMGERDGESGLVPKNMVRVQEEVATTMIADMNHFGNEPRSSSSSSLNLVVGESKVVQALYDYNPYEQSRNENPEEELTFQEGDYIFVSRLPDEDGFYEGELKGNTGLVPKTFVKPVTSSDIINNTEYKISSIPCQVSSPMSES